MTNWQWFWLEDGGDEDGGWCGEFDARELAIADARANLPANFKFWVIEARSSTAEKYEGVDCVPFLRTRNKEIIAPPSDLPIQHEMSGG